MNITEDWVCDIDLHTFIKMSEFVIQYDLLAGIFYVQKGSQQGYDSEGLPPQQQSPTSTVTNLTTTSRHEAASSATEQNQTRLGKLHTPHVWCTPHTHTYTQCHVLT